METPLLHGDAKAIRHLSMNVADSSGGEPEPQVPAFRQENYVLMLS